ncbi:MAG: hypothetical protein OXC40_07505 [Proteobacteria bacterium]|nr:hypothetical protein [Pseudomonadota bacterium]
MSRYDFNVWRTMLEDMMNHGLPSSLDVSDLDIGSLTRNYKYLDQKHGIIYEFDFYIPFYKQNNSKARYLVGKIASTLTLNHIHQFLSSLNHFRKAMRSPESIEVIGCIVYHKAGVLTESDLVEKLKIESAKNDQLSEPISTVRVADKVGLVMIKANYEYDDGASSLCKSMNSPGFEPKILTIH